MSQTVQFKNEGLISPEHLNRALQNLGWVVTVQGRSVRACRPNEHRTNIWYLWPEKNQPVTLNFDGDYRRDLEAILGSGFTKLNQGYRMELLQDAATSLNGELVTEEVLADGSVDLYLEIELT